MGFCSLNKWIAHQLASKGNCYSYVGTRSEGWGWKGGVILLFSKYVVGKSLTDSLFPLCRSCSQHPASPQDSDSWSQMVHLFIPVYLFIADTPSTKFILNKRPTEMNSPRSSSSSSTPTAAASVLLVLAGWVDDACGCARIIYCNEKQRQPGKRNKFARQRKVCKKTHKCEESNLCLSPSYSSCPLPSSLPSSFVQTTPDPWYFYNFVVSWLSFFCAAELCSVGCHCFARI